MKKFILSILSIPSVLVASHNIDGLVTAVKDGDTFLLQVGKINHTVRLADIDAPESGQPYGNRAKQALNGLIFKKNIHAQCRDSDKYGRYVCTVFVGNLDVNMEMVRTGHAWVYSEFNQRNDLPKLERDARKARIGLWGLPESDILAPQEWRKAKKGVQNAVSEINAHQRRLPSFSCGEKNYCSQMISCDEAIFYLQNCGLSKLDGNGDGVPCEKLCLK